MPDAPTQYARVDLGVVSFEATDSWRFFPMDGRIVGRPTNGVGVMQIVRLPAGVVSPPASHERCMGAAKEASGCACQGPGSNRARDYEENCMAGGESFAVGGDFMRVWYRYCPDGMVAAWFACPANRAKERTVAKAI